MSENTEAQHREAVRRLIDGDHAFIEAHSGQAGLLKVIDPSKVTRLGAWLRRTSLVAQIVTGLVLGIVLVTTWRIIWFMYCRAGVPMTWVRAVFSTLWS